MTNPMTTVSIDILGKTYQIKCDASEVHSLQRAATFLAEKMYETRENAGVLSLDRIAVITALNIAHQFLNLEDNNNQHLQQVNQRINNLQNKMDHALKRSDEWELGSIE